MNFKDRTACSCCNFHFIFLPFRSAAVRTDDALLHPSKVPTRPLLPAPRAPVQGPPLHLHPDARAGRPVDHKVHQARLDRLPDHGELLLDKLAPRKNILITLNKKKVA